MGVLLVAGLLRFVDLGDPTRIMFDETYYAKDACNYIHEMADCKLDEPQREVHPPLGKWIIAGGIALFGFDSFGWRVAAALAGTISVGLLYLLARRLLGTMLGALLAAGLLAIDFLHFVQSRISMLDIFVPMFGLAAMLFLVIDRDRADPEVRRVLARPWLLAAGASGGAAFAVKWSGVFFLVAVGVLAIAWEIAGRRSTDSPGRSFGRALPTLAVAFVLVPLVVYVLSYIGRLDGSLVALPWSEGSWVRAFVEKQVDMAQFHSSLDATHGYQSEPWSWLLLKRPVAYFFETGEGGDYQEIIATGSPFVWWASIMALVFVLVRWVRTRDFRGPEVVIVVGFLFAYGPWLLPIFNRSAVFLFYLVPAVPFMCLALAYTLTRIGETWEARAAQALFVAGALGLFLFYLPLLTKQPLSRERWDARIWVFDGSTKIPIIGGDGCEKPPGELTTTTLTETAGNKTTTRATQTRDNADLPPNGWCWI